MVAYSSFYSKCLWFFRFSQMDLYPCLNLPISSASGSTITAPAWSCLQLCPDWATPNQPQYPKGSSGTNTRSFWQSKESNPVFLASCSFSWSVKLFFLHQRKFSKLKAEQFIPSSGITLSMAHGQWITSPFWWWLHGFGELSILLS